MERKRELIVADSLNFRIQRFSASGDFLSSFGINGDRPGSFSRPKGVATDSHGHVYVVPLGFPDHAGTPGARWVALPGLVPEGG